MQAGTASRGVVPFENSSNGSVVFTLDLFADREAKYPDILVEGEVYVSVSHCLLGYEVKNGDSHEESAEYGEGENHHAARLGRLASVIESPKSSGTATPTPEKPDPHEHGLDSTTFTSASSLAHITKLYSHPQAWGQCTKFLSSTPHLKSIERQDVSSTSRAAQLAAQDKSGKSAAISSLIAARANGLDVLREGIEDRKDNTTRFFVLRRRGDGDAQGSSSLTASEEDGYGDRARYKTLVTFTVPHENPGALASSLQVFSGHGLNLTSINTRPSGTQNWNYIFFVELQGRREGGTGEVDAALKELGSVCRGWRWLGSWENALGR